MRVVASKEYTDLERSALVQRLREGDESAIEDTIEAYIEVARECSSYTANKNKGREQDVYGVGFSALVDAVHGAHKGALENDNLEYYIRSKVRYAVKSFIRKDYLIVIPHDELIARSKRNNGLYIEDEENPMIMDTILKGLPLNTIMSTMPAKWIPIKISYDLLLETCNMDIMSKDDPMDAIDDIISEVHLTAREIRVTLYRLDNYTLAEIGKELGLTGMHVHNIVEDIKAKMLRAGYKPTEKKISGTKVCTRCGSEKSLSDYHKRSDSGRATHKSICKQCAKEKRDAKISNT